MMHVSPSLKRRLLLTGAMPVVMTALSVSAFAQAVEIADARTTGVETATAGTGGAAADVTTTNASSFILTGAGPALTLNSDNALISGGPITITDVDDATGILVDTSAGALTGSLSVTGNITVDETYAPTDTDEDRVIDGPFAEGSGRTGILISGADTFTGPVTVANTMRIEGNDSAGIRVLQSAGIIGNVSLGGGIAITGDNVRGIDLRSPVTGNVLIGGAITSVGEDAEALNVSGDVSDRLTVSGTIRNTGNRNVASAGLPTRQNVFVRDLYDDEDTLEAGSAVNISGNVDGGVYLAAQRTETTDADGVVTSVVSGATSIAQVGTAAAVLIAGDGTQIIIGRVSDITDATDDNFNSELQFSLVNEAAISASSVLDDRDATAMRIADATLTDGFNNLSTITSQTYRSPVPDPDDADAADNAAGDLAISTALDIGAGADISTLRNAGVIGANTTEAIGLAYADADAVLDPNPQRANGILIDANAIVPTVNNLNGITAAVTGRTGQAYALVDASGTLATINNQGIIQASGTNSDPLRAQETDFTLVAVDVSANSTGITLTQSVRTDLADGATPATPRISGDVLLGSGDDTFTVNDGSVIGNVSFGGGADTLTVAENAFVGGAFDDSDGLLTLNVAGSLAFNSAETLSATSATFSETSTYSPFIDGDAGAASTLLTSGTVTFEDGATITPLLANVISGDQLDDPFVLIDAGTLTINGDISTLQAGNAPFLYNVDIDRADADNTQLVATFAVKSTSELGLDTPQAAAFAPTFAAITTDNDLGAAFASITDETTFNAAYNQLLPEFGAAVARFVHSNTDGATGAVSTHLKNARISKERPGGAWIEEFAYFADRELAGMSEAYRGYGFGFTGGFDTTFGPFHTVGVNVGFAATEVEDVVGLDDPLAVQSFQTGVYAGYELGNLGVDFYAGGGYNDIESARDVEIGSFSGVTEANWGATHLNAAITAGYDFKFGKRYFMRPTASVSYLSLTEEAYTEEGSDAIRFLVDERTSEIGSATALVNFGAKFGDERIWWSPSVRFGAVNEFEGAGILTRATYFNTNETITLAGQEFPSTGAIFGFSIAAGSQYSSFGFDYDADIRDGYNRHIARLVLRLLF